MTRFIKWGIITIITLGIISTVLEDRDESNIQTINSNNKNEEVTKNYKIGDEAEADNLFYKVESMEERDSVGSSYLKRRAKGKYLMLKVRVTNNDKKARVVDNSYFQLIDNKGIIYEPDAEADTYANDNDMFFFDEIKPKTSKTGYIAFDVADSSEGFDLNISDGMLSREKTVINLN